MFVKDMTKTDLRRLYKIFDNHCHQVDSYFEDDDLLIFYQQREIWVESWEFNTSFTENLEQCHLVAD